MLPKNRKMMALALLALISFSQPAYSFPAWLAGLYSTAARLITTTIACSKEYPKASQAIAGITFFGSLLYLIGWKKKKQWQAHQQNIKEEQNRQAGLKKQESARAQQISQSKDACEELSQTLQRKKEALELQQKELERLEEAEKLQNDRAAQEKLRTSLKHDIAASKTRIKSLRDECERLAKLHDPANVPQNLAYWLEKHNQEESKDQKK